MEVEYYLLTYPGSISDSEITEKSGTILFVEKEHEIMSDRVFSIQDCCVSLNVVARKITYPIIMLCLS